jgi:DNA-directed RNA polymerase specialized sigma24 family protein
MQLDLEYLLKNWGAWLRSGTTAKGHCFSIEGRYRSPQCWYPAQPREPEANVHDAFEIERVMPNVLPKHRRALKFHYVFRMEPRLACKRLAIRYAAWDSFLNDARTMVVINLTLRESRNKIHANSVSSVI